MAANLRGWPGLTGVGALAALLSICALSAPVRAHEFELVEKQKAALTRFSIAVSKLGATPELAAYQDARAQLACFSDHELAHLSGAASKNAGSSEVRAGLQRGIRCELFLRTHGKQLEDPFPIAWALGSERPLDLVQARRLLLRQPLGNDLMRVASALIMDGRPEVRLTAGRIALVHSNMRGANDSTAAIARRLLVDRDPIVAGRFAMHVPAFRDRELMDVLVARLADDRVVPAWKGATVGEIVRRAALAEFERGEVVPKSPPRLQGTQPDQLREYWKHSSEGWAFGPDPRRWEQWIDTTCRLHGGSAVKVRAKKKTFWLHLRCYVPHPVSRDAFATIELQLTSDREGKNLVASVGAGMAAEGVPLNSYVTTGLNGDGAVLDACLVPLKNGTVRARVRFWKTK